uniref:Uncharacterized protein MANES_02G136300 n=1 Tax=Rhizophora mucronata TaxID=61149 RepID=A0A2P2PD56_RHIMU
MIKICGHQSIRHRVITTYVRTVRRRSLAGWIFENFRQPLSMGHIYFEMLTVLALIPIIIPGKEVRAPFL